MAFYKGSGGAIFEIEPPTRGTAKELFDEKIVKGELVEVDPPAEPVEQEPAEDAPKPRRGRKPAVEASDAPEPVED